MDEAIKGEMSSIGPRRATVSVEQAGEILGISRSSAFQAVTNGELPVIRIGRRLLVPRSALEKLLGGPILVDSGS